MMPDTQMTQLKDIALTALDDLKAENIQSFDVRGNIGYTDLIIVATGTSTRHVKSLANKVIDSAHLAQFKPIGVEGEQEAEWILVDMGDVIIHIMTPDMREFYQLEKLFSMSESPV